MKMLFLADASVSISDALLLSLIGMGIVFLVLVVLMLVIRILTAIMKRPAEAAVPAADVPPVPALSAGMPPAQGTAGEFDLNGVDEKTAAMAMAIVADEMKTPLNELRFKSIKEVREEKKK